MCVCVCVCQPLVVLVSDGLRRSVILSLRVLIDIVFISFSLLLSWIEKCIFINLLSLNWLWSG